MSEAATRRLRVFGLVQGVGYRASLVAEAERLGIKGWVRNRLDGSVEALVQGEATQLDKLTAWAHKGPRMASVSHVEVTDATEAASAARFAHMETYPTQ
jgi:acylphosphatase